MIMSTNSSFEYPNRAASSWKGAMSNDRRMSCRLTLGLRPQHGSAVDAEEDAGEHDDGPQGLRDHGGDRTSRGLEPPRQD